MKSFLAAVLGIIASIIVVYLGEMLAMLMFPVKVKIDPTDIEAIREMIKHVPFLALITIIISHGLGMLIGSFVSFKIQQKSPMPVLVIFLFMLISTISNLAIIPHPFWFMISDVATIVLASVIGWIYFFRERN
jgi:hypothetical protein